MALGAAAALASPAAAQLVPGLSFDITGNVRYDSNQLRLPKGAPTPAGQKRDDIRYAPAIAVNYEHRLGQQMINLHGQYGRDFYRNNSDLTRDRINGGAELTYRVGVRCSGVVNGNYSRRQNGGNDNVLDPEDPIDVDPNDDFGRIQDNVQSVIEYGISANCSSPGGGLSFGGDAHRSSLRNESQLRRFANSNSDSYSLFAGLGIGGPGQLQVNGSYSTIDRPNRRIIDDVPILSRSGVKTYRVGLNYSRPIGTRLSGSLGFGYLMAQPAIGDKYTAPAYNVSLRYTAGVRLSFGVNGSRDVVSTSTAAALYRVVDRISLNADYKLGTAITTQARVSFTSNNYKQTFVIPGDIAVLRSKDSSTRFGVGATYSPRDLYSVGLNIDKSYRNSNPDIFDYNSTVVTLKVGIHF